MQFEWDEDKAAANLKKHGIDFRDAVLVFNDENRIEFFDSAHSIYEERYNTIGMVDEVLFVVYTERKTLRKYRAIKVVSWRVNFSTDAIADFEGLLAVNREICKQQMSEKAPPDVPPYCAVFP